MEPVHLSMCARFGHDTDRVSGCTSFVLPIEEFVVLGVIDEVDCVKS